MREQDISIAITGLIPGTGSTTAAQGVAKELGMEFYSAGYVRRAIAHHWSLYKTNAKELDLSETWSYFENLYKDGLIQEHVIDWALKQFGLDKYDEAEEATFTKDMEQVCNNCDFWEKIPDKFMAQKQGVVIEGKVAVALDILLQEIPVAAHGILRIVLDCDPAIAAWRVIQREHANGNIPNLPNPDTVQAKELIQQYIKMNAARMKTAHTRIPEAYGAPPLNIERLKNLNGYAREASRETTDLNQANLVVHVIDTTKKTPEEVQREIIEIYQNRSSVAV